MTSTGSVSRMIDEVRCGHPAAEQQLWNRFQPRLMAVARSKLKGASGAVADEEDVVITAFHSFLRRTRRGSFPNLHNRDDLWRLLVTITARKALNQVRNQNCDRRKPAAPASLAVPKSPVQLASAMPTPEFTATMNDLLSHLIGVLDDGELQQIVILKLQGYSNSEVAEEIGRSLPTVERRVRLIRETWMLQSDEL